MNKLRDFLDPNLDGRPWWRFGAAVCLQAWSIYLHSRDGTGLWRDAYVFGLNFSHTVFMESNRNLVNLFVMSLTWVHEAFWIDRYAFFNVSYAISLKLTLVEHTGAESVRSCLNGCRWINLSILLVHIEILLSFSSLLDLDWWKIFFSCFTVISWIYQFIHLNIRLNAIWWI